MKQLNMNLKEYLIKYWWIIISVIIVIVLFFPINTEYYINYKIHHSIVDLGFADYGVFSALIVGLLSFTATIYTNDKNLNINKLSGLPDDYLNLIIKLENKILFYKLKNNINHTDLILTFFEILQLWNEYDKAFRLIFPKLHLELMNFFTENATFYLHPTIPERNAQLIICDIKINLMNTIRKNKHEWRIKNSKYCTDEILFDNIGDTIDLEFNTSCLEEYLENIKGIESKKYSKEKYLEMNLFIEKFIEKLDKEIEKIQNI